MRAHLVGLVHAVLLSGAASELAGHGAGSTSLDGSYTTSLAPSPSAVASSHTSASAESHISLSRQAHTAGPPSQPRADITVLDPWSLFRAKCRLWPEGDSSTSLSSSTSTLDGTIPNATAHTNATTLPAPDRLNATDGLPDGILPDDLPDGLESFEEWKRRHEAEEVSNAPAPLEAEPYPLPVGENRSDGAEPRAASGASSSPQASTDTVNTTAGNSDSPPAGGAPEPPKKPKGHRYNYASPDCSARVLASSPQTQHASSLLHKSRDRYMLTPCRADEHYVVVELCDEIRVEAVELAVWEFFSGVVRGVQVKVADDATGPWTQVGDFVGKNVRSVQIFDLPEPTSFHRFLRLDFSSHYGTEYYCPVSQLKVYGMNQMEAFKMEQRRFAEASGAKDREREREREREKDREEERQQELQREAAVAAHEKDRREREDDEQRERELCELEKLVQEQAMRSRDEIALEPIIECPAPPPPAQSASTRQASNNASDEATTDTAELPTDLPNTGENDIGPAIPTGNANGSASSPYAYGSGSPPPASASYTRSTAPRAESSESIYAFIIRRLTALEGNSTLVARYIDEQAKAIRTALSRAESRWEASRAAAAQDDVRRWESERMHQEDRLGRVLTQMEAMRHSMESERRLVEAQLRLLADELWFERRRNLAQLVVLVVIIALGVLSRGQTIDALLRPLAVSDTRRRATARERAYNSKHQKRLSTGPLAGLVIDVPPPLSPDSSRISTPTVALPRDLDSPRSPTHGHRVTIVGAKPPRRPLTPLSHAHAHAHARRRTPASRSFSAADPSVLSLPGELDDELTPSRRPPSSLPRRRLARSSHLHPIRRRGGDESSEAESRDRPMAGPSLLPGLGFTPPAAMARALPASPSPRVVAALRDGRLAVPDDDSQWTEDGSADGMSVDSVDSAGDTEGDGSASEVDDSVQQRRAGGMSMPMPVPVPVPMRARGVDLNASTSTITESTFSTTPTAAMVGSAHVRFVREREREHGRDDSLDVKPVVAVKVDTGDRLRNDGDDGDGDLPAPPYAATGGNHGASSSPAKKSPGGNNGYPN